jgi:hypothetical protein
MTNKLIIITQLFPASKRREATKIYQIEQTGGGQGGDVRTACVFVTWTKTTD